MEPHHRIGSLDLSLREKAIEPLASGVHKNDTINKKCPILVDKKSLKILFFPKIA
jgi:hypothetical protein